MGIQNILSYMTLNEPLNIWLKYENSGIKNISGTSENATYNITTREMRPWHKAINKRRQTREKG